MNFGFAIGNLRALAAAEANRVLWHLKTRRRARGIRLEEVWAQQELSPTKPQVVPHSSA